MFIVVQFFVLVLLGVITGASADQATDSAPAACRKRVEIGFGGLACTLRCLQGQRSEDVDGTRRQAGEIEEIEVVVHLMKAEIGDDIRKQSNADNRWKLAPTGGAVATEVPDIVAGKPPIAYWTAKNLLAFFGRDGEVNKIWGRHRIRLVLAGVKDCEYRPGLLRLDGQQVDSIFLPETRTPWATRLFRSINRVFTSREPTRLHVLLWWSISEDELGNRVSVPGYSRAAARGGPVVWAEAFGCLTPLNPGFYEACARLLAHEVGHALGLQHVDGPEETNLMFRTSKGECLTEWQAEEARREAKRQFGRR